MFNITSENRKPTLQDDIGSSVATIPSQNTRTLRNVDDDCRQTERPLPLRSLLTPRVLIAAGNYASLSLVDYGFRAIQPLFLATPIHLGGLGLPPSSIGTLLSVQAISSGIFQVFFFPPIQNRWGSKKTFIAGISTAIPTFIMFPVANALARTQGYGIAVWAAIGLQTITAVLMRLSYGQCSLHNL
jgi:MFS family permease